MNKLVSLLMVVGEEHYKLFEMLREYGTFGVSKRISITSIPEGLEKGKSLILLAHPKAIVKVTAKEKTLLDLAYTLFEHGLFTHDQYISLVSLNEPFWTEDTLKAEDFVPSDMLTLAEAFSMLPDKDQRELEKEFGLTFCMGICAYAPFGGLEYVLRPGEDELPEEHAHLEGIVEPVHIEYFNPDYDEEA